MIREHGLAHPVTTIGRGLGNTVPIPDDRATSLRHAVVERTASGYLLRDANSANGTFLNDTRINEQHLHNGDQIRIGRTLLLFTNHRNDSDPAAAAGRPKRQRG